MNIYNNKHQEPQKQTLKIYTPKYYENKIKLLVIWLTKIQNDLFIHYMNVQTDKCLEINLILNVCVARLKNLANV